MKKRKVFLMDDEVELLEVYRDTLSGQYEIETFSSPPVLLKTVEEGNLPDVFVTDMKMPGMTGIQLIQWARTKKIDRPFVIISGYSEKAHAVEAMKLGVVDLLEKPCPMDLLKQVVKRAVVHSMYQQLQAELISTYDDLALSLTNLARNYEARSIAAENELYRINHVTAMGQEKVDKLVKSIRQSTVLEQIVEATQKNVQKLRTLGDEIKNIIHVPYDNKPGT